MRDLAPPLRLTAVEYRKIMTGGTTEPTLVVARDECHQMRQMVLKLRHPATIVGDGHFDGTSLACELICAALARTIGLNVPDYAIVEIRQDFANSIHDRATRELFLKNTGLNFGRLYHKSFGLWQPMSHNPTQAVLDQLEDLLSFDCIVINGDRQISNPNLLYRGERLLLIDHSLALPIYVSQQQSVAGLPSFLDRIIKGHCASRHLKGAGCSYQKVFANWQEKINTRKLNELRAMLPASWERHSGDIDKIFNFLSSRNQHFTEMSHSLRGVLS